MKWLILSLLLFSPSSYAARLCDDGASDGMQNDVEATKVLPISNVAWFYPDDAANKGALIGVFRGASFDRSESLYANGAVASDPVWARTAGGSERFAATSTGYSVNTWHHGVAVAAGVSDRRAYIDGGSKGSDANTQTAGTSISVTNVCVNGQATDTDFFSGRVAFAAIYDDALLEANEILELAAGGNPEAINTDQLVAFYPLFGVESPEPDVSKSGLDLTLTGTVRADGPPVFFYGDGN